MADQMQQRLSGVKTPPLFRPYSALPIWPRSSSGSL